MDVYKCTEKINELNLEIMKNTQEIKHVRAVMRESFEANPNFKRGYIDNVAMYLYDHESGIDIDKSTRDRTAEGIIDLIFSK